MIHFQSRREKCVVIKLNEGNINGHNNRKQRWHTERTEQVI